MQDEKKTPVTNSHLIAAAPDLLAALDQIVKWLDESNLSKTPDGGQGAFRYNGTEYSVVRDARVAIARAKGESI